MRFDPLNPHAIIPIVQPPPVPGMKGKGRKKAKPLTPPAPESVTPTTPAAPAVPFDFTKLDLVLTPALAPAPEPAPVVITAETEPAAIPITFSHEPKILISVPCYKLDTTITPFWRRYNQTN